MTAGQKMKAFFTQPRDGLALQLGFIAAVLILTVLISAEAQSQSPVQKVVVMVGARSGASWPLWLAKEGGYYRKHDLEVELVYAVHPAPMAAVISGQAAMTSTGADLGLLAAFRDTNLTLNSSFLNRGSFAMVGAKNITRMNQLAGKRIGIGRIGDPPYHMSVALLGKFGVNDKSVQWVSIGADAAARVLALQQGQVDAALVTAPSYFRLESAGFPVLASVADHEDIYVSTYHLMRKDLVSQHPKIAEGFIKAHAEAIKRFYDDKAFAVQIMVKFAGARDPQDGSRVYDLFSKSQSFEPVPFILKDSVKAAVERQAAAQPEIRQFDFSKVIDNGIVRRLVKEGFFQQVFGQAVKELEQKRQAQAF
jgi:ABC-type nitrate/sulfonate/bicarbonate transport system substrate-binding protein